MRSAGSSSSSKGGRSDAPGGWDVWLARPVRGSGPRLRRGPGLEVPPGFRVATFADERLANGLYAMPLDARGRVVLTSRGYIRTLHDDDGDGKADRATTFAETGTGGMGLCCDGADLYFCGDGWLSRYRDADANGRADGPPEKLVPLAFG